MILAENLADLEETYKNLPIEYFNSENILNSFKQCESMSAKGLVLKSNNIKKDFTELKKHLMPIEASGGIVFNSKNEILLIKRIGKWDLPKGKIDAGETPEIAAIREVEEECGFKGLTIKYFLTTTYHTYKMHNYRFLKITKWYVMHTNFSGNFKPQAEEQITEVGWFNLNQQLIEKLETYNSIRDLLSIVLTDNKK